MASFIDLPSTGLPIAVAALAAAASIGASIVVVRMWQAWSSSLMAGRRLARSTQGLPALLRLLLPVAMPLADLLGPRLPLRLREGLQHRLRRAGLDEELLPQHWSAVLLVAATSAGVISAAAFGPVAAVFAAVAGACLPVAWLRDRMTRRRNEVIRDLPVYLDMVTLSLEAGGSLGVALKVATERAPESALRAAFLRAQGDLRAGRSRAEALTALADRLDVPAVRPLVAALVQSESTGTSLATVLRAQADQRMEERFARAERLALEAPVKMLAPLVLCIFPCTFIILGFPLLMRFLGGP